jgi:phage terminase small subunit
VPSEKHQQTDPDGLTAKERLFVEAFYVNPDPAEAHQKAGYTGKESNRKDLASQILARPRVQTALAKLRDKRADETGITAAKVVKELALIAFSDLEDFASWGTDGLTFKESKGLDPEKRRVVKAVKIKTTTRTSSKGETETTHQMEIVREDKSAALEMLAKHLGIFEKKQGSADDFKEWLEKLDRL